MTHPALGLAALENVLDAMLLDNEDITARRTVLRSEGLFKHASDITRQPERRAVLERFQRRQIEIRAVVEKADKQSRSNLASRLASREAELADLKRERDILIASHKAMLLALGEMGGIAAWRRFFERHQAVLQALEEIGAVSVADGRQPVYRSVDGFTRKQG